MAKPKPRSPAWGSRDLPMLLAHPLFIAMRPFIKVQIYDRDGGHKHPRFRFEVKSETPRDVERAAGEIEIGCAHCGSRIRPFRRRVPTGGSGKPIHLGRLYLAVTCPLDINKGCARSRDAAEAYTAIAEALGHKRTG